MSKIGKTVVPRQNHCSLANDEGERVGHAPSLYELYEYLHITEHDRHRWVDAKLKRLHMADRGGNLS
ncbi:hypothetical protein Ancab_028869 [Ancistrocladus abbreviatus]